MKGYPDGTFRPEQNITREEFAKIISNMLAIINKKTNFTDIKKHWSEEYIYTNFYNGIIRGYPD